MLPPTPPLLLRFLLFFCVSLLSLSFCPSTFATESSKKQQHYKLAPSGTQFVLIGDAWNAADKVTGYGFCSKNFYLGAFEWTVRDWKEKVLDLVACKIDVNNKNPALRIADPHHLWNENMKPWITRREITPGEYVYSIVPGAEYLPITFVNLFDTFRACNIMQCLKEHGYSLGLKEGDSFDEVTERGGAYIITTDSTGKQRAQKAVGYCFYIPNQSEWIKAGYYTPHYNPNRRGDTNAPAGYYLYPTQHDVNPRNKWDSCLENRANYIADYHAWLFFTNPPPLELSKVNYCGWINDQGEVQGTRSYYGCFDMGGNVNEWTTTKTKVEGANYTDSNDEEFISSDDKNYFYPVRGGDYWSCYYMEPGVNNYLARTCFPEFFHPTTRSERIGFRMAATEETVTPIEKLAAETGKSKLWWDTLSTGEQTLCYAVIDVAEFVGTGIASGIAFKAIGWAAEPVLTALASKGMQGCADLSSTVIEDASTVTKDASTVTKDASTVTKDASTVIRDGSNINNPNSTFQNPGNRLKIKDVISNENEKYKNQNINTDDVMSQSGYLMSKSGYLKVATPDN